MMYLTILTTSLWACELSFRTDKIGARKMSIGERLRRLAFRVLIYASVVYVILLVLLLFFEGSLLYPAPKFPHGNWEPDFAHQDLEFTAGDGVGLHGWLIPASEALQRTPPRYVLYCHGNGENVASAGNWTVPDIVNGLGATVMVFDYRGYGKSEGSPHEAGIKLDAERAMDEFCDQMNIESSEVILVGLSLGGGVATHLAANKGCKALVLQKTFSSLPDVAASKYPIFPVQLLMQNRFDSVSAIKLYEGPLFQAHGDRDRVIPIRFGEKLYTNKPRNELDRFLHLEGFGHNDGFPATYWKTLDDWLSKIESSSD